MGTALLLSPVRLLRTVGLLRVVGVTELVSSGLGASRAIHSAQHLAAPLNLPRVAERRLTEVEAAELAAVPHHARLQLLVAAHAAFQVQAEEPARDRLE